MQTPRFVPSSDFQATVRATGLAGLGLAALLASLSNVVARAPSGAMHVGPALAPPSRIFQFGTDLLGRDLASETLHALATTMDAASVAMLVTVFAGGLAGFVAARLPRALGFLLRRIAGVLTALPALFLAILFIGLSQRELAPLYAGLAAVPPAFVRSFDRARAHSAHADFARATGVSNSVLLYRDFVYDFRAGIVSLAARALAAVTIILSTASFLGFGSAPPERDLGLMIASARETYMGAWWTAAFPATALAMFILFARLAAGLDEGERA